MKAICGCEKIKINVNINPKIIFPLNTIKKKSEPTVRVSGFPIQVKRIKKNGVKNNIFEIFFPLKQCRSNKNIEVYK